MTDDHETTLPENEGPNAPALPDRLWRQPVRIWIEAHLTDTDEWAPVVVLKIDTLQGEEKTVVALDELLDTADHALRHGFKFLAAAISKAAP